jgi:hypothetical protein
MHKECAVYTLDEDALCLRCGQPHIPHSALLHDNHRRAVVR